MSDRPGIDNIQAGKYARRTLFVYGAAKLAESIINGPKIVQAQESTPTPPEAQPVETPVAPEPAPVPIESKYRPELVQLLTDIMQNPPILNIQPDGKLVEYDKEITKGVGCVSFYGSEAGAIGSAISFYGLPWHKRAGVIPEDASAYQAKQIFQDMLVKDQKDLSPDEAFASGKVVGFGAMRSGVQVAQRYAAFRATQPGELPKFFGIIYGIDCLAPQHYGRGGRRTASYKEFPNQKFQWLVEVTRKPYTEIGMLTADPSPIVLISQKEYNAAVPPLQQ